MDDEPLEYIKNNAKLFIDQCVSLDVKHNLKNKGYKNLFDVYKLGFINANDGKLLRLVQKERYILITIDKKFHKKVLKYNEDMSVLIPLVVTIGKGKYSSKSQVIMIQNKLIKMYKKIKKYYEIV